MRKKEDFKEKPLNLYNFIETLKFSTRISVMNAIRKRSDQKKLSNIFQ